MAGETIGGDFWKQVKVGRPLLYTEDEHGRLWQEFQDYCQYCKDNPLEIEDWVGKDALRVIRKKPLPMTVMGFCLFIGASYAWWKEFRKKQHNAEFLAVIRAIDDTIVNQQIQGAVGGLYQQNIVARLNGLVDHKEVANTGEITINKSSIDYSKLSNETLREIAAATNNDRSDEGTGGTSEEISV